MEKNACLACTLSTLGLIPSVRYLNWEWWRRYARDLSTWGVSRDSGVQGHPQLQGQPGLHETLKETELTGSPVRAWVEASRKAVLQLGGRHQSSQILTG